MKISFIKYKEDKNSFKFAKGLGFDIYELDKPEMIDREIEELKEKKYTTIIISNELASFSDDLLAKYKYDNNLNIIIAPANKKHH